MTVPAAVPKTVQEGNGVTVVWPYTWEATTTGEVRVLLTSPTATVPTEIFTGFSVNLVTSEVTYPVDPMVLPILTTGWKITLMRNTPRTQTVDLVNGGVLDSEVLEEGYDKTTRMIQEIDEAVARCVKYGPDVTVTDTTTATVLASILASQTAAAASAASAATSAASALTAVIRVGTFPVVDAAAGSVVFIAMITDQRVIGMYLGDRNLGINGWTFFGGY